MNDSSNNSLSSFNDAPRGLNNIMEDSPALQEEDVNDSINNSLNSFGGGGGAPRTRRRGGGLNFKAPERAPVVPKVKKGETDADGNEQLRRNTLRASTIAKAKNYYLILGVPKDSTQEAIETQYTKLCKQYKGSVDQETFQDISKAYAILGNKEMRQLYGSGDLDYYGKVKITSLHKVKNFYNVLGLPKDCSKADIQKAYEELLQDIRPDVHADAFLVVTRAYKILSDQVMRNRFDNGQLNEDGSIREDVLAAEAAARKAKEEAAAKKAAAKKAKEEAEAKRAKEEAEAKRAALAAKKAKEEAEAKRAALAAKKAEEEAAAKKAKEEAEAKRAALAAQKAKEEEEARLAKERIAAKRAAAKAKKAEKEAAAKKAKEEAAAKRKALAAKKAKEEAAAKKAKEEAAAKKAAALAAKKAKEEKAAKKATEEAAAERAAAKRAKRAAEAAAAKKAMEEAAKNGKKTRKHKFTRKPKSNGTDQRQRGPPPPWFSTTQDGAEDSTQSKYRYSWKGDNSWLEEAGAWAMQNSNNYEEVDLETAYELAPKHKWKTTMHKHDGRLGYYTIGEHKEYKGKSIKKAIEKFKANPHLYAGLSFQTAAMSYDKSYQKYTLVKRSGTDRLTANGKTGDKKKDTHTLWIHDFQQLRPYPDNRLPESDAYTSKMTYQGSALPPPLLPGRGMGIGDLPILKIIGDVDPTDISQGHVEDCWLLSAISAVAEFDGSIKKLFRKSGQYLDYMPFADGRVNFYTITLYDLTTWKEVDYVIDESLCAHPDRPGHLLGSKPSSDGELWVPYLEKALAIHCGGWDEIEFGRCTHAWAMMTGCKEQFTFMRNKANGLWQCLGKFDNTTGKIEEHFNSPNAGPKEDYEKPWPTPLGGGKAGLQLTDDELFLRMVAWDDKNYIVAAGSKRDAKQKPKGRGMVENHAYAVLDAHPKVAGTDIDLLWLRNPWGNGEAEDADFGDNGPGWDEYPAIKAELNPIAADDGLFYVTKEEFFMLFDHIYLSASDMTNFLED